MSVCTSPAGWVLQLLCMSTSTLALCTVPVCRNAFALPLHFCYPGKQQGHGDSEQSEGGTMHPTSTIATYLYSSCGQRAESSSWWQSLHQVPPMFHGYTSFRRGRGEGDLEPRILQKNQDPTKPTNKVLLSCQVAPK